MQYGIPLYMKMELIRFGSLGIDQSNTFVNCIVLYLCIYSMPITGLIFYHSHNRLSPDDDN